MILEFGVSAMRRREFITFVGGAAAWPIAARAQQPQGRVATIGWPGSFSFETSRNLVAAFHQGLKEIGYVEGQNVRIEYRWADNQYGRLPGQAADLVRRQVDVIVAAGGEPAALAARAATSTIPIVFSAIDDPVRIGLVASFNRPGGNASGMSIFNTPMNAKRLQLLHELVPKNNMVALLLSRGVPDIENQTADVRAAADTLGLDLRVLNAESEGDFDRAFVQAVEMHVGAMMVHPTAFVFNQRVALVAAARQHAVPTIYPAREFAVAGGLLSYGIDFPDVYRQAGVYAGRVLKGEKVGDLPVQQPVKFVLAINLNTAKELGIAPPDRLLALADEVIE
jgi:putative ABC transport system substrate-binding protein